MASPSASAATADRPLFQTLSGLLPRALMHEARATLTDMLKAMGAVGPDDLDALTDSLAARDRTQLGAVYDALRETEVFRRIVTAEPLAKAAAAMVGARRLHSPFQHAVFRMDLAGEGWRGFGWHQDFPYNVLSATSVTAWIPLTPAGAVNGGVDIVPTACRRIFPVEIRVKRDAQGQPLGTRDAFIAPQFHRAFETACIKPEMAPGDVLMFHNAVVHRSGRNPGPRHRYSIQVRFGDLMAPEMLARRWRHRSADGFDTFAELHPELIAFKEDL
jgi:ectoine hydroxylase-related dioxygenase (phytanoyl-CoA dioxygenase family)